MQELYLLWQFPSAALVFTAVNMESMKQRGANNEHTPRSCSQLWFQVYIRVLFVLYVFTIVKCSHGAIVFAAAVPL